MECLQVEQQHGQTGCDVTWLKKIKSNKFTLTDERDFVPTEDIVRVLRRPSIPKFGRFAGQYCFFEEELNEYFNSLH